MLVEIEPRGQTTFTPSQYPVLVVTQRLGEQNNYLFSFGLPAWGEAWLASLWPANPDPCLAGGIQSLLTRLDAAASNWEPLAPLIEPLLHAERAWSEAALQALGLGIFSRDADARAVAIDTLVEGLLDGRAHPEPLARTLSEIARHGWAKLNHLAESLRQVTRVSRWGSLVIARILDELIATWEIPPRDAHHLLELQLELLMELEGRLSLHVHARRPLQTLTGSSKTAKLARHLLQRDAPNGSAMYRTALAEGVESRIAWAEIRCC